MALKRTHNSLVSETETAQHDHSTERKDSLGRTSVCNSAAVSALSAKPNFNSAKQTPEVVWRGSEARVVAVHPLSKSSLHQRPVYQHHLGERGPGERGRGTGPARFPPQPRPHGRALPAGEQALHAPGPGAAGENPRDKVRESPGTSCYRGRHSSVGVLSCTSSRHPWMTAASPPRLWPPSVSARDGGEEARTYFISNHAPQLNQRQAGRAVTRHLRTNPPSGVYKLPWAPLQDCWPSQGVGHGQQAPKVRSHAAGS